MFAVWVGNRQISGFYRAIDPELRQAGPNMPLRRQRQAVQVDR